MCQATCVFAGPGPPWLELSMETTRNSRTPTSTLILVSLACKTGIYNQLNRSTTLYISGVYFTGDGARRDADGHYQITGRVDDVINVKGHRMGTAELESAMVRGKGESHGERGGREPC